VKDRYSRGHNALFVVVRSPQQQWWKVKETIEDYLTAMRVVVHD
jgi:hypothetical protein